MDGRWPAAFRGEDTRAGGPPGLPLLPTAPGGLLVSLVAAFAGHAQGTGGPPTAQTAGSGMLGA